jgi:hypothetical protein
MVRLFIDNDLTDIIVDGVVRHYPEVDLVRARDVGMRRSGDPLLLEWAANAGRVMVSHDETTMTDAAYSRLKDGLPMLGVFIVPQSLEYRVAIEDLAAIALCSEPVEWENRVTFLPLVK